MNKSELIFQTVAGSPDSITIRAAQFYGSNQSDIDLAVALVKAGHRLAPAEGVIPGLWQIDGGPELTTNQMRGEAYRLLSKL